MLSALDRSLRPGHMLHEYRIESTLGIGGFGVTYLATDTNLNLKVAIKEYLPANVAVRTGDHSVQPRSEQSSEPFHWGLARFLDESRTLAAFRHPNIVRVMRFFEAHQTAYMVMEFVEGECLYTWARSRRPLDERAVRAIVEPLLEGLDVVHRSGYLHRDIKPANIFVRRDGTPVLLDFGAARVVQNDGAEITSIVSPGYAPLEQYHASGYQGAWSDLYALGGVMYWLVTGEKPLDAPARVHDDPLTPCAGCGDQARFGERFLRLVDWMLSPMKHRRPQSVDEVRRALQLVGTVPTEVQAPAPPASREEPVAFRATEPELPSYESPSEVSGVRLEPDTLKRLEVELARHLGPIASLVVRSAAKRAATPEALVEMASREIPDATAREDFLRRNGAGSLRPMSPEASLAPGSARFGDDVLRKYEAVLARHIGPLARVVVKRAANKARDEGELVSLLESEIDDPRARSEFRRTVGSRSSA